MQNWLSVQALSLHSIMCACELCRRSFSPPHQTTGMKVPTNIIIIKLHVLHLQSLFTIIFMGFVANCNENKTQRQRPSNTAMEHANSAIRKRMQLESEAARRVVSRKRNKGTSKTCLMSKLSQIRRNACNKATEISMVHLFATLSTVRS